MLVAIPIASKGLSLSHCWSCSLRACLSTSVLISAQQTWHVTALLRPERVGCGWTCNKCAWTCSWVGQLRTSSCALAWKLHTHTVATALLHQTKRRWTKPPCERKQSCPSEIPAENVFLFECPSRFTKTRRPTFWILNPCLKHPPQLLAAVTVGGDWGPSFVSCYDMHFMERPGFWPCWAHTALRLGAPRERPICGIHQGWALLLGFCQKPEGLAMVEGRLVGPQFTQGFGLVEDGGLTK